MFWFRTSRSKRKTAIKENIQLYTISVTDIGGALEDSFWFFSQLEVKTEKVNTFLKSILDNIYWKIGLYCYIAVKAKYTHLNWFFFCIFFISLRKSNLSMSFHMNAWCSIDKTRVQFKYHMDFFNAFYGT